MFKCRACAEKDKHIRFLEEQNKDLYDRLMAFNKDAFVYYKAENKKGEDLYPIGITEDGKLYNYKDMDLEKAREEEFRAFGENPISVEDDNP